jgi:hypothetical protein
MILISKSRPFERTWRSSRARKMLATKGRLVLSLHPIFKAILNVISYHEASARAPPCLYPNLRLVVGIFCVLASSHEPLCLFINTTIQFGMIC